MACVVVHSHFVISYIRHSDIAYRHNMDRAYECPIYIKLIKTVAAVKLKGII